MLEAVLLLAAATAIAFIINLVPAFMPSTWMVMAAFYIQFDLPFVPLIVLGTLASAAGRLYLSRGSEAFRRRFLSRHRSDIDELGAFLNEHRNFIAPIVFLYALTPLPTNTLFIAGGMARVSIGAMLAGFIASRLLANGFWVWTADLTINNLGDVLRRSFSPLGLALQVVGLASIVALYMIPWGKWLRRITSPSRGKARAA